MAWTAPPRSHLYAPERGDPRNDPLHEVDQRGDDRAHLVPEQCADADADHRVDDQDSPGAEELAQVVAVQRGAAPRAPA